MRRVPKLKFNKHVGFILFLGLIVAFGAGLGLYTRNQRQNAPQRSLEALTASLNEVVLAASSLKSIDGSADTSPFAIASTQAALKNSLNTSKKLLGNHKKTLGDNYEPLAVALDEQQKSYEELQAAYEILGKAISYNPSLDIGGLDITQHKKQIQERSFATNDNLFKLAETYEDRFTDDANRVLNISINCFGELSDQLKDNQTGQVEVLRTRCINTYKTTRKELVSALINTYLSKKSQDSLGVIQETITAISTNK